MNYYSDYYLYQSDSYISVESPQDGHQSYQVRGIDGSICAFGTAIDGDGYPATEVQVANLTAAPDPSSLSTPNGTSVEVNGCGQWEAEITGASHSSSGYGESNWLVVWAQFSHGWTVQVVEYMGSTSLLTACQSIMPTAFTIERSIVLLRAMPGCKAPIKIPANALKAIQDSEAHPDDADTKKLIELLFEKDRELDFDDQEFNSAIFKLQDQGLSLKYTVTFVRRKPPVGLLIVSPSADNAELAKAKPVRFATSGNGSIELEDPANNQSAPKKAEHYFRAPILKECNPNGGVKSLEDVLKREVHLMVGK